jgi:hypothetical protein
VASCGSSRRRSQEEEMEEEADIDIGEEDSLSDCGSGGGGGVSDSETAAATSAASSASTTGPFGPFQYTEADVLRSLNSTADLSADIRTSDDESGPLNTAVDENGKRLECPACRQPMSVPVLNVACWHLKCERCWLHAVGTTKTCSICRAAASVRELRRVHV